MRSILTILCLIFLVAGAAVAQATAPSVFLYDFGKGGGDSTMAAHTLENMIGIGLLNQFPCVDQMNIDGVRALLGLERMKELIGAEPNNDTLKNVGASLGAQYVIVVTATTMPNGQTYVDVVVFDSRTGRAVARRDGPPTSGDALNGLIESLSAQVLKDMAGLLKGKCTPHWSGMVTFKFKYESIEDKAESFPGGDKSTNTRNYHSSWLTEDFIQAMVYSKGSDDQNQAQALVVHRFNHRDEHIVNENEATWCRPKGANSIWKRLGNRESDIGVEQGEAESKETVWVTIDKSSGTYKFSVKYPAVRTKSHREITALGVGCFESKPTSAVSDGEGSPESSAYIIDGTNEVRGTLDPKNPDVLIGTTTTGDETSGIHTIIWNLRLVKPKSSR
ncbi:hypothetical protein BH10ACI3_BH10ACI3_11770 [soil metagenome]